MKSLSLATITAFAPCNAFFRRASLGLLAMVASFGLGSSAVDAATISIQFQGLNIAYSNATSDIVDVGNPEPLNLVEFYVDDDVVGSFASGVTIDLDIPGLPAIPLTGGVVNSAAGGSLYLDFGAGDFLDLELASATVAYVSATATVNFTFGGSVASINGQSLPFGLELGDPVSMSFSTQVTSGSLVGAAGNIGSFLASGSGEVSGALVPEPSSLGLLALGGLLATMAASRYRLG